jgi:hypothetical protein
MTRGMLGMGIVQKNTRSATARFDLSQSNSGPGLRSSISGEHRRGFAF